MLLAPYPASVIPIVTFPFLYAGPMPLQSTASSWQSPGGAWLSSHLLSLRSKPGLCSHTDRGCLLLHYLAKGRITSLRVSLFPPDPILRGQWGLATVQHTGSCNADMWLCWYQPLDTVVYGQEKLSIPPQQCGRAGTCTHPMGSPCVGAQQAQPDPKLGYSGTTCLHRPLVTRLLLPPQQLRSPTTRNIPFTLDIPRAAGQRGQLVGYDLIPMSYFDSFYHRDVALGSRRMEDMP